jgi:hypothetical protein
MTPVCSCGDGRGKVYHGGRMIPEGANIYTWWSFTSGVKLANIGLVKKHRGYERTNENGTEGIRMEEIQNLVRISCVVRISDE